jgi:hypothetical protein
MSTVALTGGAYTARSLVAAAQRSVNLFIEPAPAKTVGQTGATASNIGEPSAFAHYPTPGLAKLGTVGPGPIRGLVQASNGAAYCVSGSGVYSFFPAVHLGDVTPGLRTPVSMRDNGLELVIVDDTASGWTINLAANTMSQINDPNFVGSTHVDFLDTYFLFNKKASPQFYVSDSLALTFDPLWFANKEARADYLVAALVAKREVWLIGARSTEVWFDSGNAEFPFEIVKDVFIPHGCVARYSPVRIEKGLYWLSRDENGQGVVYAGVDYAATRVSTYAIENAISKYERIDDAEGWTYQLAGHHFYVLTFPHDDHTWVYDITTGQWHEWVWIDTNGTEHRHRARCGYNVNGAFLCGDWETGDIYQLSNAIGTDDGHPIKRLRAFPHILSEAKRVFYRQFIADMETGRGGYRTQGPEFPANPTDHLLSEPLQVSLRWSDDRGHTWGSSVLIDLGMAGDYLRSLQWQRLGMARDRVFEISWSTPYPTVLQGAWIDTATALS